MKLRGAKVNTGGMCYSRALCTIGGKDVVGEVKGVEEGVVRGAGTRARRREDSY